MKQQRFDNFLREYVKSMNSEHTLSLYQSEKLVEGNNRFLTLVSFYLLFNEKAANTLRNNKQRLPKLYSSYETFKNEYLGLNLSNLNTYVLQLSDFDELKKLYMSYKKLSVDTLINQKKLLYQEIHKLMLKKKITKYKIYANLHYNPGNTNDFLKNQKYEKLSVDKIMKIHAFCSQQ